jgi:hypothetical protein
MAGGHVFVNTYRAPIGAGVIISSDKPGEKIAKAITEIQDVISKMEGTDGGGGTMVKKVDPAVEAIPATWSVRTWNGVAEVWDYVRAHA